MPRSGVSSAYMYLSMLSEVLTLIVVLQKEQQLSFDTRARVFRRVLVIAGQRESSVTLGLSVFTPFSPCFTNIHLRVPPVLQRPYQTMGDLYSAVSNFSASSLMLLSACGIYTRVRRLNDVTHCIYVTIAASSTMQLAKQLIMSTLSNVIWIWLRCYP